MTEKVVSVNVHTESDGAYFYFVEFNTPQEVLDHVISKMSVHPSKWTVLDVIGDDKDDITSLLEEYIEAIGEEYWS